ncbi:MAG: hypothetical protein KDA72_09155 [Planctomycetales bacterium]|nr:hypothetical protein [Planctomycetales bacterium]
MDSETPTGRFDTVITLLSRPLLLLQGSVEYMLAWTFTRSWWRLLLVNAPWALLCAASVGLVGYGALLSRQTLAQRYSDWVAEELPEALRRTDENAPRITEDAEKKGTAVEDSDASGQASDVDEKGDADALDGQGAKDSELVSGYGELLLRRLLQLQNSNSRITYLVAAQLARQGRLAQARQMMRRIAPLDSSGFAPAHHWLAADELHNQQIRTPEDRTRLIKDLAMATRWGGCHPALRSLYSQLLESQGDVSQAMAVLERGSGGDSDLEANLAIARLAAKHGQQGRFERAAGEIKQEVQARVDAETVTSLDWAVLANVLLYEQKPAEARQAAQSGLKKDPANTQLRRLLSESFRIEYSLSIQHADGQTKLKLGLLDAALKADPTNPSVGTEIARLLSFGQDATPELKNALEQQLAAGQATAITHILLANRQLLAGEYKAAQPHLELALRQAPDNPITMNNLALVLSRTEQEPKRAEQLAMAAVASEPRNADFHDSLGEIRARNGDSIGAIECYETAIGLNPNARSTRKKLADLYRELGMNEMAEVQERELQKSATKPPADPPQEALADSPEEAPAESPEEAPADQP